MTKKSIRNKRKIKLDDYENAYKNTTDEKKLLNKSISREIKFTIVSIFVILMVTVSSAYAIYTSTSKSKDNNSITVGTLKVDFLQDTVNILNLNGAYPETDINGLKEKPYEFSITNTGSLDANYKIRIVDDTEMITTDKCQDNLLEKNKIKVAIGDASPFILETKSSDSYTVFNGNVAAGSTTNFSIRLWIDGSAGNEVLGKHYHGKIIVDSVSINSNS